MKIFCIGHRPTCMYKKRIHGIHVYVILIRVIQEIDEKCLCMSQAYMYMKHIHGIHVILVRVIQEIDEKFVYRSQAYMYKKHI